MQYILGASGQYKKKWRDKMDAIEKKVRQEYKSISAAERKEWNDFWGTNKTEEDDIQTLIERARAKERNKNRIEILGFEIGQQ